MADVDGPYTLASFSATDGSYRLTPNPSYGGGPGPYATILVNTYPSITAQLSALRSGGLDVGSIDFSQLGTVPQLRAAGFSVFGGPSFGWLGGVINFKDTTGHFDKIIGQLYVRQALAHLIDQPAYVKTIFKHAAAVNYGPVPKLPANPYTPSNNASRQRSVPLRPGRGGSAAQGARLEGRARRPDDLPEGRQRRRRVRRRDPGRDAVDVQLGRSAAIGVADERARGPGVRVRGQDRARGHRANCETRTFDYQLANFDDADPTASANRDDWAIANDGGFFYNYYPASDQTFSTGGVFNTGGFSDARADTLMRASVFGPDPDAVTARGAVPDGDRPGAVRARARRRLRGLEQGPRRPVGVRRAHPAVVPAPVLVPERLAAHAARPPLARQRSARTRRIITAGTSSSAGESLRLALGNG